MKPTYEELEQRIKELEKEVEASKRAKKLEEGLREIEHLYRTLIEGPLFAMIIHDVAPYFVTRKAAELFGYNSPEELTNSIKDIEELFEEKYRVNMKERRARRYETKETSIVELVGLRKDGTEIPLLAGINVTDWKGGPAIQCTYYDITGLKQAEDALRKYGRIVASSNDHMALVDRNYVFLTANDAYLQSLDKKREDIVGHSVSELFGQKFFEKTQKPNIDRCLAGEIVQYQMWVNFSGIG